MTLALMQEVLRAWPETASTETGAAMLGWRKREGQFLKKSRHAETRK